MKSNIYLFSNKEFQSVNNLQMIDINFLSLDITSQNLKNYDTLVFTSKNSVLGIDKQNLNWKQIPSYVLSDKIAQLIISLGGNVSFVSKTKSAQEFAKELVLLSKDDRLLHIRAKHTVFDIQAYCKLSNVSCDSLVVYETICVKHKKDEKPKEKSILIFTSPSTVKCFLNSFKSLDDSYKIISIGNTTAKSIPKSFAGYHQISSFQDINKCIELAKKL